MQTLDHTSILKMIEWRWGLDALTVRDDTATNLADVLDFSASQLRAKQFDVPTGPFGSLCSPGLRSSAEEEWLPLLRLAADFGWPVDVSGYRAEQGVGFHPVASASFLKSELVV